MSLLYVCECSVCQNTLLYLVICSQGDAEYLRYHGMQEFDQAMQHLEAKYGVSIDGAYYIVLYVLMDGIA